MFAFSIGHFLSFIEEIYFEKKEDKISAIDIFNKYISQENIFSNSLKNNPMIFRWLLLSLFRCGMISYILFDKHIYINRINFIDHKTRNNCKDLYSSTSEVNDNNYIYDLLKGTVRNVDPSVIISKNDEEKIINCLYSKYIFVDESGFVFHNQLNERRQLILDEIYEEFTGNNRIKHLYGFEDCFINLDTELNDELDNNHIWKEYSLISCYDIIDGFNSYIENNNDEYKNVDLIRFFRTIQISTSLLSVIIDDMTNFLNYEVFRFLDSINEISGYSCYIKNLDFLLKIYDLYVNNSEEFDFLYHGHINEYDTSAFDSIIECFNDKPFGKEYNELSEEELEVLHNKTIGQSIPQSDDIHDYRYNNISYKNENGYIKPYYEDDDEYNDDYDTSEKDDYDYIDYLEDDDIDNYF